MSPRTPKEILEHLVATHGAPPPERRVFDMAQQFHAVGVRSLRFESPEPGVRLIHPAPGATCLGFAAELYLKCFYTIEAGKGGHGHRLNVLFARLTADTKDRIAARYLARTGRDAGRLQQDLGVWANVFVDWRYVFERTEHMRLDTGALAALNSALYDVTKELRPTWAADPYTEGLLASATIRPGSELR